MAKTVTAKGVKKVKFRLRFLSPLCMTPQTREVFAVHESQARKIADGIARKNVWKVTSVGKA